eukprot:1162151-Pelagomonas_calceolata.AAC.14
MHTSTARHWSMLQSDTVIAASLALNPPGARVCICCTGCFNASRYPYLQVWEHPLSCTDLGAFLTAAARQCTGGFEEPPHHPALLLILFLPIFPLVLYRSGSIHNSSSKAVRAGNGWALAPLFSSIWQHPQQQWQGSARGWWMGLRAAPAATPDPHAQDAQVCKHAVVQPPFSKEIKGGGGGGLALGAKLSELDWQVCQHAAVIQPTRQQIMGRGRTLIPSSVGKIPEGKKSMQPSPI